MTRKHLAKIVVELVGDKWCECESDTPTDAFKRDEYFENGRCNCGVFKHHYHCKDCGKLTQIG